jgi:hypothetical protein
VVDEKLIDLEDEGLGFYSVHMHIQNLSSNPASVTQVFFTWPPPGGGTYNRLQGIWFAASTDPHANYCYYNYSQCIWEGLSPSYSSISVCDSGCSQGFTAFSNLDLINGDPKNMTFIFIRPLVSSSTPYYAKIVIDDVCYVESTYIH